MSGVEDPLVSIVIPAFNSARWLPDALNSVLSQTYSHWECIIVDDGSLDNTREIVDIFSQKDRRIRYIGKEHEGLSSTRNAGIQSSHGEFIAFLDADDLWLPDKLMRQVEMLSSTPGVGLCCTYYEEVDEELNLLSTWSSIQEAIEYPNDISTEVILRRFPISSVPGSASAAVVRRECFGKVGLFDTCLRSGEDWDMWYRISLSYPIVQMREVMVRLRKHPASMTGLRTSILWRIRDQRLIMQNVHKTVPSSLLPVMQDMAFDIYWQAFTLCCSNRLLLHTMWFLIRMIVRDPLRTLSGIGATLRNRRQR